MKSLPESSSGKDLRSAKAHRGEGTQTMPEQSPVGGSQSNGFLERAIQTVEDQIRTLNLALEERLGKKISAGACVIPWLV